MGLIAKVRCFRPVSAGFFIPEGRRVTYFYTKRSQIWAWACELARPVTTAQVMNRFSLNPQAASRHLAALEAAGCMKRANADKSPRSNCVRHKYTANPACPPHNRMGKPVKIEVIRESDADQARPVDLPTRRYLTFLDIEQIINADFLVRAKMLECAPLINLTR